MSRIITMGQLKDRGIPFSRAHVYRLIDQGRFPSPIHLSANRIAFLESEIDAWLDGKIAERDSKLEVA